MNDYLGGGRSRRNTVEIFEKKGRTNCVCFMPEPLLVFQYIIVLVSGFTCYSGVRLHIPTTKRLRPRNAIYSERPLLRGGTRTSRLASCGEQLRQQGRAPCARVQRTPERGHQWGDQDSHWTVGMDRTKWIEPGLPQMGFRYCQSFVSKQLLLTRSRYKFNSWNFSMWRTWIEIQIILY